MTRLFLAEAQITRTPYMDSSSSTEIVRLVWAMDEADAERKFRAAFERDDSYGVTVEVDYVYLSEAIQ